MAGLSELVDVEKHLSAVVMILRHYTNGDNLIKYTDMI